MRNTPLLVVGIALIILGIMALAGQSFNWTTHETLVDVGPVKVTAQKQKEFPIWPVLGGVAIIGGIVVIATTGRGGPQSY